MSDSDQDIFELLTPFVDGELSEEAARDVERRINDDPGYRQLLAVERATKRTVAARTTRHAAPAALDQRIRAILFEGADPRSARTTRPKPLLWRLLTESPAAATGVGAIALATALILVVALFSVHRVTPFVRDVYAHHTDAERFPIQFEGNYQAVAAEASNAVEFPVTVPRLDETLALQGARKCRLCGHLMAFIKYGGTEGPVSFFVVPRTQPPIWRLEKHTQDEMTFYTADYEGVRMAFWSEETTTYCLAGSVSEDRLISLACTACREVQLAKDATPTAAPPLWLAANRRHEGP